jgi:hypothetical protein
LDLGFIRLCGRFFLFSMQRTLQRSLIAAGVHVPPSKTSCPYSSPCAVCRWSRRVLMVCPRGTAPLIWTTTMWPMTHVWCNNTRVHSWLTVAWTAFLVQWLQWFRRPWTRLCLRSLITYTYFDNYCMNVVWNLWLCIGLIWWGWMYEGHNQ